MAIWEIVSSAIGGAVGGAAILGIAIKWGADGWLATRIQTHKAALDLEMENHKDTLSSFADRRRLRLKREELMFNRELDAALEFHSLLRKILPGYMGPQIEHDDYITVMAEMISGHADVLEKFISDHEVALSADTEKLLEEAHQIAAETAYAVAEDGIVDGSYPDETYPSPHIQEAVAKFLQLLMDIKARLKTDMKNGSFGTE